MDHMVYRRLNQHSTFLGAWSLNYNIGWEKSWNLGLQVIEMPAAARNYIMSRDHLKADVSMCHDPLWKIENFEKPTLSFFHSSNT